MPSVVSTTIQVHIAIPGPRPGEWQFLLLKRSPAEALYPSLWQVVTGSVEEGETALRAAFREVEEETGITPERLWVLPYVGSFFDARRNIVQMVPSFGCIAPAADVRLSQQHCDCSWFSPEEAVERLVMPSHKEGIQVFYRTVLQTLSSTVVPSFRSP